MNFGTTTRAKRRSGKEATADQGHVWTPLIHLRLRSACCAAQAAAEFGSPRSLQLRRFLLTNTTALDLCPCARGETSRRTERRRDAGRLPQAQATAPALDSTESSRSQIARPSLRRTMHHAEGTSSGTRTPKTRHGGIDLRWGRQVGRCRLVIALVTEHHLNLLGEPVQGAILQRGTRADQIDVKSRGREWQLIRSKPKHTREP